MNKESNKYIFLYSIALVVLVAAVLAVASIALKPYQQKNREVEKQQSILRSVQKAADVKNAKDKAQYIAEEYAKYITSSFVVNSLGERVDGDAFEVDLEEEMAKSVADRKLPVFVCTDSDSSQKYILPVRGTGLWGPVWGYVALENDYNTVCGVVFDHKGETPGLGAEIATPEFHAQFVGKQIFDGATFNSIKVVKGGGTRGKPHEVDAISGGTITSKGLEDMLHTALSSYLDFFKEEKRLLRVAMGVEEEQPKPIKPAVVRSVATAPAPPAEKQEKEVVLEQVDEEEVSSDN
jgi:Na+-transporting NADH:ubiquinone oxidoreductase subunit C